ncbi:hypothetical protein F2Q70_00043106 [Brassica cretica]|uniref:Uncharacterized protein n=1 Tax=Brassica cretica TaxID=69181 RepID=A0A8S9KJ46_BRACR|nr:hypothetical protein F2Q70_00043106 [Brassica cretica]
MKYRRSTELLEAGDLKAKESIALSTRDVDVEGSPQDPEKKVLGGAPHNHLSLRERRSSTQTLELTDRIDRLGRDGGAEAWTAATLQSFCRISDLRSDPDPSAVGDEELISNSTVIKSNDADEFSGGFDGSGEFSGGFDGADEFSDEADKLYKLRQTS